MSYLSLYPEGILNILLSIYLCKENTMHSMLRSIATFIVTFFDTITMAAISLNHLARSGVERTVVVEEKSRAAAALSQYENVNNVALRLEEVNDTNSGISAESLINAQEFLAAYDAKRKDEAISVPLNIIRAEKKEPGKRKKSTK
jgi:hypothetical protein